MTEADHLPDSKLQSDTEMAIDALVDSLLTLHPNLDGEELRQRIRGCVQEHVPDESPEEEEKEEQQETET